jgi:phosphatidylserine decarboxylase
MGRFLLGSTVVLLFPRGCDGRQVAFNPAWAPGGAVRVGQVMGRLGP